MGCRDSKPYKQASAGKTNESANAVVAEGSIRSNVAPVASSHSQAAGATSSTSFPASTDSNANSQIPTSPVASQEASETGKFHRQARRARTALIDKEEVDFMVRKFICHDAGAFSQLGQGSKESTWLVQVGRDGRLVEIKLHVDRTILTNPEVGIECNGRRAFPLSGAHTKAKLREDFVQQWPFRGVARGVGERDVVEIRPPVGDQQWYPATLTRQREDGSFEALVWRADGRGGFREVAYPAVQASNIRYLSTGKPFSVPQRILVLEVLKEDPAHAALYVDRELMTHFFGRPTPNQANQADDSQMMILLKVSKDRQTITANVGHQVFAHHMSSEVRLVKQSSERHKRSWIIQIGPFAEHTIELENYWTSKLVTLTIDGEKLVESTAEDIDCPRDKWQCKFRFMGERCTNYEIYETNSDGVALDTKAIVSQQTNYSHECVICVNDETNLAFAEFSVDGVDFRDLPLKKFVHAEDALKVSPDALHLTYGVTCPFKVNEEAPSGMSLPTGRLRLEEEDCLFGGALQCCMRSPRAGSETADDTTISTR